MTTSAFMSASARAAAVVSAALAVRASTTILWRGSAQPVIAATALWTMPWLSFK
jgi:hypothetical protein